MAIIDPKRVMDFDKVNVDKLHLNPLSADPSDIEEGDLWYRGDTHALMLRINGSTKTVTVS